MNNWLFWIFFGWAISLMGIGLIAMLIGYFKAYNNWRKEQTFYQMVAQRKIPATTYDVTPVRLPNDQNN